MRGLNADIEYRFCYNGRSMNCISRYKDSEKTTTANEVIEQMDNFIGSLIKIS